MGLYQMAEEDYEGAADSFYQGYDRLITSYKAGTGASWIRQRQQSQRKIRQTGSFLRSWRFTRRLSVSICRTMKRPKAVLKHISRYLGRMRRRSMRLTF